MTEPNGMLEEEIRRALRTAGDLVVPAGDGLHKIRERTVYQPRPLAWLFAYAAHLLGRPFVWLRVAGSEVIATARGSSSLGPVLGSPRRWPRLLLSTLRSPGVWLRPVLSATAALLIVLGVALAIPRLRHTVATLGGFSTSSQSHGGDQNNGLGPGGVAQSSGASQWPTVAKPTPGQPFDATMPPAVITRCQAAGIRHPGGVSTYIPQLPGPGISQTVGAALGAVGARPGGGVQTASCTRVTRPPVTMPPSVPPTQPPTTQPTSTPAPSTTPPTSTPPTSTPAPSTTPPTTITAADEHDLRHVLAVRQRVPGLSPGPATSGRSG